MGKPARTGPRNVTGGDLGRSLPWWWPYAALVAWFAAARIFYSSLGMAFDEWPLQLAWQHVDPPLLQHRLWESLVHLHGQPPLWNAVLGIVLKLFGGNCLLPFHIMFRGLGLMLCLVWFQLLRELGVAVPVAFAVVAFFTATPAFVAFESHLFYTLPICTLLCVAALCCVRFASTGGRVVAGVGLASCLAAISLMRASFHLVWIVAVGAFLYAILPMQRRRIALSFAVPVLLVVASYAKNWIIFDQLSPSSWFGMSFAKLSCRALSEDQRRLLIADGRMSTLSEVEPFRPATEYLQWIPAPPLTGIPVLDNVTKSGGNANRHHLIYIAVSKAYLRDSLAALRAFPEVYPKMVVDSWRRFLRPSGRSCFYWQKRRSERDIFDRLHLFALDRVAPLTAPLLLVIAPLIAISFRRRGDSAGAATVTFMWLTALYVAVVFNAFENGENERFRFLVDPFGMTVLALTVNAVWQRLVERARRRDHNGG